MTDTDQTQSGDQERDETQDVAAEQAEREERAVLMQRARLMGLTISNNIGLDTLRERIRKAQEGVKDNAPETPVPLMKEPGTKKAKSAREAIRREAMKLIRIHIVNLDPKKKDLQGEIITVGNDLIGTIRKFVPYGEITEKGYHVPNIIYKMLKKRKFLNIRTRRGPKGEQIVEQNWAQEFSITVLPPLTKEELHDLAVAQAAAGSVG